MAATIQSPAKCEVRSVIRFLNAKGEHPAEIHKQIVAQEGDEFLDSNVTVYETGGFHHTPESEQQSLQWRHTHTKGRRQTSMARGYRNWFQDVISVWTMLATMLKNKVIYRQFDISVTVHHIYK